MCFWLYWNNLVCNTHFHFYSVCIGCAVYCVYPLLYSLIASVGEAHRANTTLIAQTRTFITHQFTEVSGESVCGQIHFL